VLKINFKRLKVEKNKRLNLIRFDLKIF